MIDLSFRYIHLHITLRATRATTLPSYKTSMLRGIIGNLLRQQVCHDRKLECGECRFNPHCVYSILFEAPQRFTSILNTGGSVPHPYILRCHDTNTAFPEGTTFRFELLLLGEESPLYLPYFYYLFERIRFVPFGRARGRFELVSIEQQIANRESVLLLSESTLQPAKESYFQWFMPDYQVLTIQFITPFRFQKNGKYQRELSIDAFLWQLKHRYLSLVRLYQRLEGPFSELPVIPGESVAILGGYWKEYSRYSNRQQSQMKLGGVIGKIQLQRTAELDRWLPLIYFGETFHVGKATTFGLGQYQIEVR